MVGKATPPPPPVSFAQRQQYLSANPGHPLDAQTLSHIQAARPAGVQQQQYVRPAMGSRVTAAPGNNPNLTPQQPPRPQMERPARGVPNESPRPNQVEQERLARPREQAAPANNPNLTPQQPPRPQMERPARVAPNESPRPNQVEQERPARPREQAAPVHPVNPVNPGNPAPHNVPSTPRPEMERANRPAPRVEQHTEERRPPQTGEKPAEHPKGEKREEGKEKEKKQQ